MEPRARRRIGRTGSGGASAGARRHGGNGRGTGGSSAGRGWRPPPGRRAKRQRRQRRNGRQRPEQRRDRTAGASGAGGAGGAGGAAGSAGATAARAAAPARRPRSSSPAPATARRPPARTPPTRSAAYAKWKTDIVTSDGAGGFLRVRRPNSASAVVNSTVSEGIAYGMLLAVYANDQPTFDKLWQYSQAHLDGNGLMNWYIGPAGETLGTGAATDADEDMAFALIVADARWGGRGSLTTNYIDLAKTQIGNIWQYEVDHTRNDVLQARRQRVRRLGHQHLVLRARLLPRVRPGHRPDRQLEPRRRPPATTSSNGR